VQGLEGIKGQKMDAMSVRNHGEWAKRRRNSKFSTNDHGCCRKTRKRDRRTKRNNTISKLRKTMQMQKFNIYISQKQYIIIIRSILQETEDREPRC
jgi:hypothetical protein